MHENRRTRDIEPPYSNLCLEIVNRNRCTPSTVSVLSYAYIISPRLSSYAVSSSHQLAFPHHTSARFPTHRPTLNSLFRPPHPHPPLPQLQQPWQRCLLSCRGDGDLYLSSSPSLAARPPLAARRPCSRLLRRRRVGPGMG